MTTPGTGETAHLRRRIVLALVLLAGVVSALLWWAMPATEIAPAPRDGMPSAKPAPAEATLSVDREPAIEAGGLASEAPDAPTPFLFELFVSCVDRWGLSVQPGGFLVGPVGALCSVGGKQWVGSEVHVTFAARVPAVQVACVARAPFHWHGLRMVTVRAGEPVHLTFLLGEPGLADAELFGLPRACADALRDPAEFAVTLQSASDIGILPGAIRGPGHFDFTPGAAPRRVTGRLEGIVRDVQGAPAAGVLVALMAEQQSTWIAYDRRITDASGRFEFAGRPDGTLRVRAGGGATGLAERTVEVREGATTVCDLDLSLEGHAHGRVVDDTGACIAGWRLVYEGRDPPCAATAVSADDGTFTLPVERSKRGRLLGFAPEDETRLPVVVQDVDVGAGEWRVLARRVAAESGLRVRLPKAVATVPRGGFQGLQAMVQVYQEASGRGACLAAENDGETFRCRGLAAGWYRLVATSLTHGCVDLGRHWCDGHTTLDLGTFSLPQLATVTFVLTRKPDTEPTLHLLGDALDSRIDGLDLTSTTDVQLPPGRYAVSWQTPEGTTNQRQFTVKAGEVRTIRSTP